MRANGAAEAQSIDAAAAETDGTLSVIAPADMATAIGTLDTVRRLDHARA